MGAYNELLNKLESFIRKYYKNQMLKGALLFFIWLLISFLSVSLLEYFGRFSSGLRTFLFYLFLGVNGFILTKYFVIPLFKLFKIGKTLTLEQASAIIGAHFSNVQDKILNTLQLGSLSKNADNSLAFAAIEQKVQELRPLPFTSIIDYRKNYKYLPFLFVPLVVFMLLSFSYPEMIFDASTRIFNHNKGYEQSAPFNFNLLNKDLSVFQSEDFEAEISVTGNEIPLELFISLKDGRKYKAISIGKGKFAYTFKNLQKDEQFQLTASGFDSKEYELKVLPKPVIASFGIELNYPAYTGIKSERINNSGDLVIPIGTDVKWILNSRNVDAIDFQFGELPIEAANSGSSGQFQFSKRVKNSSVYKLITKNKFVPVPDSASFQITIIPDLYPQISAEEQVDSLNSNQVYFRGNLSDDYGFSNLKFHSALKKAGSDKTIPASKTIDINYNQKSQSFYYFLDISEFQLQPGDELSYYFEVFDNDQVNGKKSARTNTFNFRAPDIKEIKEQINKSNNAVKSNLENSLKEIKDIQKDFDKLKKELLDKKSPTWEDKKKAEDLLKRQQDLESRLEQLKQENESSIKNRNQLGEEEQKIIQKQMDLEKMMDQLLNEDMKKMMKEMEELLKNLNQKDKMDDVQVTNKDIEKELDRMLEMFKQMEVESKVEEAVSKLNELAKKQEELSKKSEKVTEKPEELAKEQEKLNEEFEKLEEELEDIEKNNEELEDPMDLGDLDEQNEEIKKDQKESSDKLDKKEPKKASKPQKDAADKMKEKADSLAMKMQKDSEQKQAEDMQALRQILTNLVRLSFEQEQLIGALKSNSTYGPAYIEIGQKQYKLKDDAKLIEDSLFALSKRNPEISGFINKEIAQINRYMDKATKNLSSRFVPQAKSDQQYIMTSVNNLAVMLSESLKKMQEALASEMKGDQQCEKPGNKPGGKSGKKPSKSQGELNKQMQEMLKSMKDGKMPGQKPGDKPGRNSGMSEQFAKMAAQQEAIRRELQRMSQEMSKEGEQGKLQSQELNKLLKEMEKTEKELVNKIIRPETLKRQEDILTRLLESERAEREREQDEKRESNSGNELPKRDNAAFEDYKRMKEKEIELFRTLNPEYNSFYKQRIEEYFQTIRTK